MKKLFYTSLFLIFSANAFSANFYDFKFKDASGKEIHFSQFKNKTVLLVNIATRCGYTGQLDDLEKLYTKYKSKNFVLIGIPSNDFSSQTPEDNKEVEKFCRLKYGVNFPITEKQIVIGSNKADLIKWINSQKGFESEIQWNFEKFLINKKGIITDRFTSGVNPMEKSITDKIEANI